MLTTLPTLKSRLSIPEFDPQYDALLTNAIRAVSARFDHETNRTLARTENFTQEFDPNTIEILASCYPIESVTTFEFKTSESTGWQPVDPQPDYLVRNACVICLCSPFIIQNSSSIIPRVAYTGGYLLPGAEPTSGQTPLPADLENAALEQVASWFLNRDKLGLTRAALSTGGRLKANSYQLTPKLRSIYHTLGDWQEIVASVAQLPSNMPTLMREMWAKNTEIARRSGATLTPQQFTEMFVDQNLTS